MNKLISTLAFLSIAFVSNAQQFTAQDDATTTKSVTNISILSPAITHEIAIGRNQTIFIAGGINGVSRFEETGNTTPKISNRDFGLAPRASADFRNYYNFGKRLGKGKNINNNSGNYLALRAEYRFAPIVNKVQFPDINNGFALGGVWGIQRVYNSGIYLGLSLGLGYLFGDKKLDATSMGDFHLGFNIGSSNKK
ncbi:MAG: hypothetical protein RLZZ306_1115 [Bacteroidota bacterium]